MEKLCACDWGRLRGRGFARSRTVHGKVRARTLSWRVLCVVSHTHTEKGKRRGTSEKRERLLVIGGGAAGYFAAINAKKKERGRDDGLVVAILEQGKSPLEKVRISGGGRCNVTNVITNAAELAGHYPRGHRELKGAFFREFGSEDVREWFTSRGVPLKVENDGRIFPVSNSSQSIIDCLQEEAKSLGIELLTGHDARSISVNLRDAEKGAEEAVVDRFEVTLKTQSGAPMRHFRSSYLLLATGSSRSGWDMARHLGHNIIKPYPSLFSFKCADKDLVALAGISMQDCHATLHTEGGVKFQDHGPILITHWGLSGPLVLKLSAWAARELAVDKYKASFFLDLVGPSKNHKQVEEDFLAMKKGQKKVGSSPPPSLSALPKRLWHYVIGRQGIDLDKPYSECKDVQLRKLAASCKRLDIPIRGKGPFKEEFVTAGGVDLKEVNMKTLQSKLVEGLYFAGEILNVDGVTGGFNFQNAWTSGYLSGTHIATQISSSSSSSSSPVQTT